MANENIPDSAPEPEDSGEIVPVQRELQGRYESRQDDEGAEVTFGWFGRNESSLTREINREVAWSADSRARDKWLGTIWRHHPMMAGVISSMVERDKNRGWSLTGAYRTVKIVKEMLHKSDRGAGWREHIGQQALQYYTSDFGAAIQAYRGGERVKVKPNRNGDYDIIAPPVTAFFSYDSTNLRLSGNWKYPAVYQDPNKANKARKVPLGELLRFCSMRSPLEEMNGLGFCFMSRSVQLLRQMLTVLNHYDEMITGRVPRGFVTIKGISQAQFNEALGGFEAALARIGGDAFNGVIALANDGGREVEVKFTPVSQLPENFNVKEFYELMMMGLALCAGFPADEFWQISTGRGYGRGLEMENLSARAGDKGRNAFAVAHQEQLQADGVLPARVMFEYYKYDVGEREQQARMLKVWADLLKTYLEIGLPKEAVHRIGVEESALPAWVTTAQEKAKANDIQSNVEGSAADDADAAVVMGGDAQEQLPEPVSRIRERLLDDFEFRDRLESAKDATDEPIVRYDWSVNSSGFAEHRITDLWRNAEEALARRSFPSAAI